MQDFMHELHEKLVAELDCMMRVGVGWAPPQYLRHATCATGVEEAAGKGFLSP